jgi:hypothetical protein
MMTNSTKLRSICGKNTSAADDRIPIICASKGTSPDLADRRIAKTRQWLYDGDFEQYKANVLAGLGEEDMFDNFDTVRDRITASGGNTILALAVATFYLDPLENAHVQQRATAGVLLVDNAPMGTSAKHEEKGLPHVVPHVEACRPVLTLYLDGGDPVVMVLGEFDIGNRKLNMLIAMCERENEGRFIKNAAAKLARGILRIREPGGVR